MKILVLSDEPSKWLYDFYEEGKLDEYDLILSCGDLPANYLSFLVTFARAPLLYVTGNHDHYDRKPPEGCICIDDQIYEYKGVRILGLGGSMQYIPGAPNQYTEKAMEKRVRKLQGKAHNPNYTEEAVKYKDAFFAAYQKALKKKQFKTEADKQAFKAGYDWNKMTGQDMKVWKMIFEVLDR